MEHVRTNATNGRRGEKVELSVALSSLVELVVPSQVVEPLGTYLFTCRDAGWALARHVEEHVFLETFGDDPEMLADAYRPYEQTTVFLCVLDHRRLAPAGSMRIVLPSAKGQKTTHDLERVWGVSAKAAFRESHVTCDTSQLWDVATIAVPSDYRRGALGGIITLALIQATCVIGARAGGTGMVAILDEPVLKRLQRHLHKPFSMFAGLAPRPYFGSPASIPVWLDADRWFARLAKEAPALHDILVMGTGIEHAVRPLDWNLAAAKCWQLMQLARIDYRAARAS